VERVDSPDLQGKGSGELSGANRQRFRLWIGRRRRTILDEPANVKNSKSEKKGKKKKSNQAIFEMEP